MQLCHTRRATSAVFDDPNLVSSAGLVLTLPLPERAGLGELTDQHLSVPTDEGANAKLSCPRWSRGRWPTRTPRRHAAAAAGRDGPDLHRRLHSLLRSFLRSFAFGQVRQLDAVALRLLLALPGLGG